VGLVGGDAEEHVGRNDASEIAGRARSGHGDFLSCAGDLCCLRGELKRTPQVFCGLLASDSPRHLDEKNFAVGFKTLAC
jgi:hypothetical protein